MSRLFLCKCSKAITRSCQSCHSELKSNMGSVSSNCALQACLHHGSHLCGSHLHWLWCRQRKVYICVASRKVPFDSMSGDWLILIALRNYWESSTKDGVCIHSSAFSLPQKWVTFNSYPTKLLLDHPWSKAQVSLTCQHHSRWTTVWGNSLVIHASEKWIVCI